MGGRFPRSDELGAQMKKQIRIDVYGKRILVSKSDEGWQVCYVGAEGKRRPAYDINIPPSLSENDLIEYISDLCHEWATPGNSSPISEYLPITPPP